MLQFNNKKRFRFCLLPPRPQPPSEFITTSFKMRLEKASTCYLTFSRKTKHLRSAQKLESDYDSYRYLFNETFLTQYITIS